MFVIKLTNGRGFVEYYRTLAVRAQARTIEEAQQFDLEEEAREMAEFCEREASAFSSIYWSSDRWTLQAEVVPLDATPSIAL